MKLEHAKKALSYQQGRTPDGLWFPKHVGMCSAYQGARPSLGIDQCTRHVREIFKKLGWVWKTSRKDGPDFHCLTTIPSRMTTAGQLVRVQRWKKIVAYLEAQEQRKLKRKSK